MSSQNQAPTYVGLISAGQVDRSPYFQDTFSGVQFAEDFTGQFAADSTGQFGADFSGQFVRIFQPGANPGSNWLNTVTSGLNTDEMSYAPHGPLTTRLRDKITANSAAQRIEQYTWDPYGLIKRFEIQQDEVFGNTAAGCEADASVSPATIWTYRFNPFNERELKRQTHTAGDPALDGLAWTYYQIGSDKSTLTTYNGIEGGFCGEAPGTLFMWPIERNTYGPRGVRLVLRPTGETEVVISDHLGSTRAVTTNQGDVLETIDYRPFGEVLHSQGEGARTGYIDREEDGESGLGCYGVRLYEPEYGRFTSVDPLWEMYRSWAPYQYSTDDPLLLLDPGGNVVEASSVKAEQAVISSVGADPELQKAIKFVDGVLDAKLVKAAAVGYDVNSNIAVLSRLAENNAVIRVHVAEGYDYIQDDIPNSVTFYTAESSVYNDQKEITPGMTLLPQRELEAEKSAGRTMPVSPSGVIEVIIPKNHRDFSSLTLGQLAAHELVGHVSRYLKWLGGTAKDFWHENTGEPETETTRVARSAETGALIKPKKNNE